MKKSIGLLEFKSIAKGMEASDAMVKSANVQLLLSTPICPGKYISLITGDVGSVKNAIEVGRVTGDIFTLEHYVIPNVSEGVFPALSGTMDIEKVKSLGIIETISAVTSIMVGDIAIKAANVALMEIRMARGLGGKGFVLITGEVAAVKQAIKACENGLEDTGGIVSAVTISSPNKELISKIM